MLDRELPLSSALLAEIGNAPRVDHQPLIDRAGDGIEGARIEAGELPVASAILPEPCSEPISATGLKPEPSSFRRQAERTADRRPRAGRQQRSSRRRRRATNFTRACRPSSAA